MGRDRGGDGDGDADADVDVDADANSGGPPGPPIDGAAVDLAPLVADLSSAGGVDDAVGAELRGAKRSALRLGERGAVGTGVRRLDRRDVAEAFLGCVVLASPLLVEDGIFEGLTERSG